MTQRTGLLTVVTVCGALLLGFGTGDAQALMYIHEVLADPASGLDGDANGDGTRSTSQDEFVELFNSGDETVDLSGWYLTDATSTRHTFGAGSFVDPHGLLVVFGGGSPAISGVNAQIASSGGLSLNNGGDTVSLYDFNGSLVNQMTYGSEGGDDQSLVRSPEGGENPFVKHLELAEASGQLYSPGTFINPLLGNHDLPSHQPPEPSPGEDLPGDPLPNPDIPAGSGPGGAAAVPEPASLGYAGMGLAMWFMRRRR